MMNIRKLNNFLARLTLLAIVWQMLALAAAAQSARRVAATDDSQDAPQVLAQSKIAPDLRQKVEGQYQGAADARQKVIIQLRPATALNEMSGGEVDAAQTRQLFAQELRANQARAAELGGQLANAQGRLIKSFNNLGLVSAELPLSQIRQLSESENVAYISPEREVKSFQHVGLTTGYYNTGISDFGDADPNTWLAGGVGQTRTASRRAHRNHCHAATTTISAGRRSIAAVSCTPEARDAARGPDADR